MRQGVHRGTARFGPRKSERQFRLVHDGPRVISATADLHPARAVAGTEVPRPLRAAVRRGDGDEREAGRGRDRLGGVDRAAATQHHQSVVTVSRRNRGMDALESRVRLNAVEPIGDGQIAGCPARRRDQQRVGDRELLENGVQLTESPADDHRCDAVLPTVCWLGGAGGRRSSRCAAKAGAAPGSVRAAG